jgi:hypothetical protein
MSMRTQQGIMLGPRVMRPTLGALAVLAIWPAAGATEPRQVDLDVPPTAVVVTVKVTVKPRGALLLYAGGADENAIRFSGPASTRTLPIPSRTVGVELIDGAKSFEIKILGRIDALDGAKMKMPPR